MDYNALEGLKMRYTWYCGYLYTIRPIYSLYHSIINIQLSRVPALIITLIENLDCCPIEKEEVARRKRLEPSNIDIYTI